MRNLPVFLTGLTFLTAIPNWCQAADDPAAVPTVLRAVGTVEPATTVDVYSLAAGRIASLGEDPAAKGKPLDYGSKVESGTVLARLDSELQTARVEIQRAGCQRAKAELIQANIVLKRSEALWRRAKDHISQGVITATEFDTAQFNFETARALEGIAKAAVHQAEAALKAAEIELDYTVIRSPIKGVILDRRVSVGQLVAPAASARTLFIIGDLEKMQVWASIPEAYIGRVHRKQPVRFTVDAFPGNAFRGEVQQIRPNANMTRNVVTYTVVVEVLGEKEKLTPYLTAKLEFE